MSLQTQSLRLVGERVGRWNEVGDMYHILTGTKYRVCRLVEGVPTDTAAVANHSSKHNSIIE